MSVAAESAAVKLICISGPDLGKRVSIRGEPVTIGKSAGCEIASDDGDVAERHVALRVMDGSVAFHVADGSAVFVDGQRAGQQGRLAPGEQLRIGRSLWQIEAPGSTTDFSAFLGNLGGRISEVAGVEKIEGFDAANMFSEVLRKRSDEEMEQYFAVGTPTTTPPLSEVNTLWPRPWLFVKIFVLAALVYLGLLFAYQTFHNDLMLPGLIMMGAFVMPFSLLIFFFEVNAPRNVPLYQILKMLFLGGILSVIFALTLFQVTKWGEGESISWFGAIGIGLIEEAGKVAALLLIVNKVKYRWTLNGLLFGAAVGAGFAAFESAGYAYNSMEGGDQAILHSITTRGLLCICGGHVLWCALEGGALWRVRGDRKFEWSMLKDIRFLRVYLLASAMHALWDSPLTEALDLKYIALGFVVWVAVLSFIQVGLRQIKNAQAVGATEFFRQSGVAVA